MEREIQGFGMYCSTGFRGKAHPLPVGFGDMDRIVDIGLHLHGLRSAVGLDGIGVGRNADNAFGNVDETHQCPVIAIADQNDDPVVGCCLGSRDDDFTRLIIRFNHIGAIAVLSHDIDDGLLVGPAQRIADLIALARKNIDRFRQRECDSERCR